MADAFMVDPAGIGDGLRSGLLASFSAAEIVELTLDVVAWTMQKWHVALGTDAAVDETRLTPLTIDASGHVQYG